MSVRIKAGGGLSFAAFVSDEAREVRVRYTRRENGLQWRCDSCGAHRYATCPHQRAALAAVLDRLEREARNPVAPATAKEGDTDDEPIVQRG